MLTENDVTDIQKIALREILLVAAKMEDHSNDPNIEVSRVGKLLRHYATERMSEIEKGDLNRPAYEEKERAEDWSKRLRYEISRAAQPIVPHLMIILLQIADEQLRSEGLENSVERNVIVRLLNAIAAGEMNGRLPTYDGQLLG